jgi:hypothetical protein
MDDAAIVGGGEARADLPRELDRAVLRKAADAAQQRRKILAVHVLHRQEGVAIDLADVVDTTDVRVRHLPCHADFGGAASAARDRGPPIRAGTSAPPAARLRSSAR